MQQSRNAPKRRHCQSSHRTRQAARVKYFQGVDLQIPLILPFQTGISCAILFIGNVVQPLLILFPLGGTLRFLGNVLVEATVGERQGSLFRWKSTGRESGMLWSCGHRWFGGVRWLPPIVLWLPFCQTSGRQTRVTEAARSKAASPSQRGVVASMQSLTRCDNSGIAGSL